MIRKLCLISTVALLLTASSSANAFWPYAGYGGGFGGYGYGWGFGAPTDYVSAPPYYAIYPPVYYSSRITARPYGASPFAWQGGMSPITYVPRPEISMPAPEMIENPFVASGKAPAKQAATRTAEPQPLTATNPFVASR
jgi:hypothetical protein